MKEEIVMTGIIDKIRNISGLGKARGCSLEQIEEAQKTLGITFPEEFIEYVKEFGCIDFGATEWTGLNIKGYLNTVTATQREISANHNFPKDSFVLEDMDIDAKKVIVDESGKVSMLQYDKITPLCNSISEYLDMCIERNK